MLYVAPQKSNYHGTIPPRGMFKDVFTHTLRSFVFLLENGKHTLKYLAYLIREHYSLENERNLASVAILEAESIWQNYVDGESFPAFAPHSPHVVVANNEWLIRCPLCTDCHATFKGNPEFEHTELHRHYWATLNHMQQWHQLSKTQH